MDLKKKKKISKVTTRNKRAGVRIIEPGGFDERPSNHQREIKAALLNVT